MVGLEWYLCSRLHVLEFRYGWVGVVSVLQEIHSNPTTPKLQHTSNQEQYDQCGNSTAQSQAPVM